jgi:hypothetical protein
MPQYYKGLFAAAVQKESFSFDPTRGFTHNVDFKGLGAAQMDALYTSYVLSGIACEIENKFGIWSLIIDDTTQQYTIDSWQLVGAEENFDIFSHPTIVGLVGVYGDSFLSSVRQFLQSPSPANNTTALYYYLTQTDNLSSNDALTVASFFSLNIRGTTEFRASQYALRHTTNAPNRYQANVSDVNVNYIYTTSELLTEVLSSSLWIYPLPGRLQYKINAIPVPSPQNGYEWGWLKSSSTETTAANNRIDISTDYQLALWSTYLYGTF